MFKTYLIILTILSIQISCRNADNAGAVAMIPLSGRWKFLEFASKYNTQLIFKKYENDSSLSIILEINEDKSFTGYHDANTYSGTFEIEDNHISVKKFFTTDLFTGEVYNEFIKDLQNSKKYQLISDTLKISI